MIQVHKENSQKLSKKTPPPAPAIDTIKQAIEYINSTFLTKLPNKNADIQRIMEYVTGLNESGILHMLEKPLTRKQQDRLLSLEQRILRDEPLEYITGVADFHGRKFHVNRHTLIPRVETETLVDLAVGYAHERQFSLEKSAVYTIVDVGTGTGCIIISTALCLRGQFRYFATDISTKAVATARRNISAYALGRNIHLTHGNLLEPIDEKVKFDIVVANLPYIKKTQMSELQPSVKNFEPHLALDGGINGASLIRELLVQAQERLNPRAVILLEVQPEIIETVRDFARRFYPDARQSVVTDTFEVDRFVVIET